MTAVLTGLVVAAALLPLWAATVGRGGDASMRLLPPALLGCAVALATGLAAPDRTPRPLPLDRPIEQPVDGYVGSATCRACHPREHQSWHASYHRTMTQPLSRQALQASFGGNDRLDLSFHGSPVGLQWRGDELWVELDDRRPRRVVQLTGSHHAQVLWYATGEQRELGAVPMVYRIREQRWLPIDAVFLMPPEAGQPPAPGTWNGNCSGCHTTHVMPGLDTDRTDTRAAEFGIACEACHGPGRDHVTANRDPLRRYRLHLLAPAGGDQTVTEPQRLDPARRSEVCGQCHSVSIVRREHFDSWREQGSPYRPGERLAAAQLVVTPAAAGATELRTQLRRDPAFFRNTFWPDGQVRVTGREYNGLLLSPCHHGDGERAMGCLSCHRLHPGDDDPRPLAAWADSQLRPGMAGDAACLQCHQELAEPDAQRAHSHHGDGEVSCYDCHMPRTAFGLLAAQRSHVISSPDVQTELDTTRPNACNLCHLDRTLQWTADRLADWYGTAEPRLDDEQRAVAAGPRWLLTGDAAVRVLVADAAGRPEAARAAGTGWLVPYLGQLLADPYLAVRFVAERSLRATGAVPPEGYDFLQAGPRVREAAERVQAGWRPAPGAPPRPELLLGAEGVLWPQFRALLARRDDRPIALAE